MKISGLMQNYNKIKIDVHSQKKNSNAQTEALNLGKETPLDEIRAIYRKHNQPLEASQLKEIDEFFKETKGSKEDKLKALDLALEKSVPIEKANLEEIHAAIKTEHGRLAISLSENNNAVQEPKDLKAFVKSLDLPEVVKDEIIRQLEQGIPLKEIVLKGLKNIQAITGSSQTVEAKDLVSLVQALKSLLETVDPSMLRRILTSVQDVFSDNPTKINVLKSELSKTDLFSTENSLSQNKPHATKFHMATETPRPQSEGDLNSLESTAEPSDDAEKVDDEGYKVPRELDGNKEPVDLELETKIESAVTQLLEHLEMLTSAVEKIMDFKVYLVRETTEATLEAKNTFKTFQKEFTTLLEKKPVPEMKENLEKAITALDRLLKKSSVSMFSDMHMERDLLKAMADLDKAKVAFKAGDINLANDLMKQVKSKVDKIQFNPSITRIQAFASSKADRIETIIDPKPNTLEKIVAKQLSYHQSESIKSPSDVFETLRFMGLTHEVEIAETLEGKTASKNTALFHENIKEILLKLMKTETDARTIEKAENHMMNLAGQQSMTQQDSQEKRSLYFFNYPLRLSDGDIGEMKIYVQGAKSGARLDANNASLYFAVKMNRLGEVGVKLKTVQGTCDITVIGESCESLKPFFLEVFEAVESMGYTQGTLSFKESEDSLEETTPPTVQKNSVRPRNADERVQKGFDFKI